MGFAKHRQQWLCLWVLFCPSQSVCCGFSSHCGWLWVSSCSFHTFVGCGETSRAFDPRRCGLGEGLGGAQAPCQAHLPQRPPWSCSSPSNKCSVNTCSTPLGHLLIILSPLLITWRGFTPHPSFLRSSTQCPPSVSLSPTSVMASCCALCLLL